MAVIAAACSNGGSDAAPDETPATTTVSADALAAGTLVDIGGRSLFVQCRGTEGPTVVLEAGLTGDHGTWQLVMSRLPTDTRACAYDRANIQSSDTAPTPRSAQDVVDDLQALLTAIRAEEPYALVGFSFGGIFAQLYAAQHPDAIGGLVLVESNHPDEADQFEAHLTREQIAADRAEVQANDEGTDVYASFDQAQDAGPLPAVPLVVITATSSDGWPPGWDPLLFDQLRAEQQADLATRVPGGQQVSANGSGHDVPHDRPDVVVDAINHVLAAVGK